MRLRGTIRGGIIALLLLIGLTLTAHRPQVAHAYGACAGTDVQLDYASFYIAGWYEGTVYLCGFGDRVGYYRYAVWQPWRGSNNIKAILYVEGPNGAEDMVGSLSTYMITPIIPGPAYGQVAYLLGSVSTRQL